MGTQIFGGLGPGLGLDINPFDPEYERKIAIAKNQAEADKENSADAENYRKRAADLKQANIQQLAAHQPLFTLDPPRHKRVVDTNGNIIDSTDLVCEPISVIPDAPTGPPSSPTGAFPTQGGPMPTDQLVQVLAMLRVLKSDLDAIKAKLSV